MGAPVIDQTVALARAIVGWDEMPTRRDSACRVLCLGTPAKVIAFSSGRSLLEATSFDGRTWRLWADPDDFEATTPQMELGELA